MLSEKHLQRDIARIAIPVSIELVVQLAFGLIDQVIVGALGAVAIAAVGFANSIISVGGLSLAILGTGTAILVSQAQGGGQQAAIGRIASVALMLATLLAAVIVLPMVTFATPFLHGLGARPELVAAGQGYFQVALLTLPLTVISAVASATLRALGHARTPMLLTLGAVLLNTLFGYLLVFGGGPFPVLGVVGAAWATLIAQGVKTALLVGYLYGRRLGLYWDLPGSLGAWSILGRSLLGLSLPLLAKEIFWSGGTFVYTLLFARISTNALAASQIVSTFEAIFIVASIGLMSAATILIGQAIGGSDTALALARSRALLRVGSVTGIVCGSLFFSTNLLVPIFFPRIGTQVAHIAFWGITINSLIHIVKVRNMIMVGILPSSGDTRGVMIGDGLGSFAIGLPLAYLLAFSCGFGVWGIFLARAAEEIVKHIFFAWRIARLGWSRTFVASSAQTLV